MADWHFQFGKVLKGKKTESDKRNSIKIYETLQYCGKPRTKNIMRLVQFVLVYCLSWSICFGLLYVLVYSVDEGVEDIKSRVYI